MKKTPILVFKEKQQSSQLHFLEKQKQGYVYQVLEPTYKADADQVYDLGSFFHADGYKLSFFQKAHPLSVENFKYFLKKEGYPVDFYCYPAGQFGFKLKQMDPKFFSALKNFPIRKVESLAWANYFGSAFHQGQGSYYRDVEPDSLSVLGLLDSGVAQNLAHSLSVKPSPYTLFRNKDLNKDHGTAVAGIVNYGAELSGDAAFYQRIKILDFPLVSQGKVSEDQVIAGLEKAFKMHPEVKIWNMSLSLSNLIDSDEFSDLAMNLDYFQDTYNILILKSAGNDFKAFEQPSLMMQGSESLRCLTVASLARRSDAFAFTQKDQALYYSRQGPETLGVLKPDLGHYGGDVLARNFPVKSGKDLEFIGERTIALNGQVRSANGTSFATPKLAKLALELKDLLDLKDCLYLKALMIHSGQNFDHSFQAGYGKPLPATKLVEKMAGWKIERFRLKAFERRCFSLENWEYLSLHQKSHLNFAQPQFYIENHYIFNGQKILSPHFKCKLNQAKVVLENSSQEDLEMILIAS